MITIYPTSQRPRRRMFHRQKETLPPLSLTERDLRVLGLIQEHRFLNTAQVQALVGGSTRNVGERLSRLFHHGYLDRPAHQRELRAEGYRHLVYALGLKGAQAVAGESGRLVAVPRHLAEDNRTAKRFYLAHTLMVAQFRVCLTLASKERPGLQLVDWRVPERPLARVRLGAALVSVMPDAQFVLQTHDGRAAHFFLEADRGTMSHKRFLAKLQGYWGLRGAHPNGRVPRAFRVLTIAPSRKRIENLLLTARDADPRQTGSRMFCFATETTYSLENPRALFAAIWRTPADGMPRSILDGMEGHHG